MTTPAGEDRLLDLGEIERALQAATPGPWRTEAFRPQQVETEVGLGIAYCGNNVLASVAGYFETGERGAKANAALIAAAPDWLAQLCARVRHLEAQVEHEHANATAILRKYERAIADADRAELASQRLTEAITTARKFALSAVGNLAEQNWEMCETELGAIIAALSISSVGAGAPPEDAR